MVLDKISGYFFIFCHIFCAPYYATFNDNHSKQFILRNWRLRSWEKFKMVAHMLLHASQFYNWAATERSSVTLCNPLDFVLFTYCKWVRSWTFRCVDDFVSEALSNRFTVSESWLTRSLADKINRLVNSTERRYIDSLSTNNTTRTNTRGIFTSTAMSNGIN